MDKIFACEKCGAVYYDFHPTQCMRYSLFSGECASESFKEIKKEDVLDIHELPRFLFNEFIKKLF